MSKARCDARRISCGRPQEAKHFACLSPHDPDLRSHPPIQYVPGRSNRTFPGNAKEADCSTDGRLIFGRAFQVQTGNDSSHCAQANATPYKGTKPGIEPDLRFRVIWRQGMTEHRDDLRVRLSSAQHLPGVLLTLHSPMHELSKAADERLLSFALQKEARNALYVLSTSPRINGTINHNLGKSRAESGLSQHLLAKLGVTPPPANTYRKWSIACGSIPAADP
ncbi:hypothetical protein [Lysobacter gummosus]|uniref:Uncharacterized protein n=1 Tax=Lysobacter gummosus TaxID=262324 RepID=A0ABY3X9G1_9GAMM|nr:hypothetical protein [Lysobacter gummosus]UNP29218.1 hypothetical protein MOV92_22570 [Lysobacter gummosus]